MEVPNLKDIPWCSIESDFHKWELKVSLMLTNINNYGQEEICKLNSVSEVLEGSWGPLFAIKSFIQKCK